MINLLKETLRELEIHGKTVAEVRWCGSSEFGAFSWERFAELADQDYDNGFGATEVCIDLVVVGDDWWLEREEYDGSEHWAFKRFPQRPADHAVSELFRWGSTLRKAHQ